MKGKLKKFFVNHGEKLGMAVVGLIVLAGLAGADWAPYSGTPGEITTKVASSQNAWNANNWGQPQEEEFAIKPENEPKAIVAREIGNALPLSEFTLTQKFVRNPYETTEPLRNPEFKPLEEPIATAGRVLLAVVDEKYQKEMELRMQGLGPDGKPLPAGTFPGLPKPMDDNIPDEFRQRPGQGLVPGDGTVPGLSGEGGINYDPGMPMTNPTRGKRGKGGAAAANNMLGLSGEPLDPSLYGEGGMMPGMGMGAGLPPGQTGRGMHYISVRAVFPLREQILKIAEATNLQPQQAAMALEILDYEIQRQTKQESGDPWGGAWEPVDINVSTDVLTKMAVGLEPDVVYAQVTDPAITMPLPARVAGQWYNDVTHPRIQKFTLTEDQIRQEVLYQEEALKKLEELKKELPPPPAQKKGWTGLMVSGMQLNSMMMGGDAGGSYGGGGYGFAMPGAESAGAYGEGGGGYGAGNMGMAMGGMGAPVPGQKPVKQIKPIDDLLKMKDKERAKEIEEYVKSVVQSAAGELLLFRYIDFSVEPGKTYRYRARLVFRNPNFNRNADEAAGDTSVVTGETRTSDWSKETTPVAVQKDQQTFVTDVRTNINNAFPAPQLNVFQWDPALGSTQQSVLTVNLGQTISGKKKTSVLDHAKATFEDKEYEFRSNDFVVDAQPDVQLEAAAHPDVKPVGGTRGDLMLPEQVLVAMAEGGLSLLDPSVSKNEENNWKTYIEKQNERWKQMQQAATAAVDPLLGGGDAGGAYGEGGDPYGGGYMGRGLSPLQSKGKKSRRPVMPIGP